MAIFDPSKYEEEPRTEQSFFAPGGVYELYFGEMAIKETIWPDGNKEKMLGGKVFFMDGPREGKYFYHDFRIFQADAEKRKQACIWFGNFIRAIGEGALDPEEAIDRMVNKTFQGEVEVVEKNGKKSNRLKPWAFHKVGGDPLLAKPSTSKPASSGASSGASSSKPYEDDVPF